MSGFKPMVEKFIVVGVDSIKQNITYNHVLDDQVHPTFLDIFPFEQQESSSYLDNFKMWCFPDGFTIYDENLMKINGKNKMNSIHHVSQNSQSQGGNIFSKNTLHHFVLTNQNSERKYCSGLLIHEEVFLDTQSLNNNSILQSNSLSKTSSRDNLVKVYIPKMICIVSSSSVIEFQKQFLSFVYKFGIATKQWKQPPLLKVSSHLYDKFSDLCEEFGFLSAEKKWLGGVFNETIQHLRLLSPDDPLSEKFILKEDYLVNFAVSMVFRTHLLPLEINEGYSKELILTLSNEEVCKIRMEKRMELFQMNNISYRPLLERISIQTLISFLNAILLEKQILIISQNVNEIISICEAMFALIYPLKWVCLYIPVLPIELSEMLSALMPYIIGISKQSFSNLKDKIEIRDKVIIDLDQDKVFQNQTLMFPEYLQKYLQINLRDLIKQMSFGDKNSINKEAWIQTIFSLKRIFFRFMICLINNFSPFILYSNNLQKNVASNDILSISEYIDIFDKEERPYMLEMVRNTMMFNKFVEESYKLLFQIEYMKSNIDSLKEENDQENLLFYLTCLKKIQKIIPSSNSDSKFNIILNSSLFSSLDQELQSLQNKAVIESSQVVELDLTSHLIKYLRFIEQKPAEALPQFQIGSSKYLTQQGIVLQRLNKDWISPISLPSPSPRASLSKMQPEKKSYHINLAQNQVGIQISTQDNKPESNRSINQRVVQRSNIVPTNIPKQINDIPSSQCTIGEESSDPTISSEPILFFRNMFMEYDSYSRRHFKQEFDSFTLKFPQKQITKSYEIFKRPTNKPSVEDPMKIYLMQEQLQVLLQKEEEKKSMSRNNQSKRISPIEKQMLSNYNTTPHTQQSNNPNFNNNNFNPINNSNNNNSNNNNNNYNSNNSNNNLQKSSEFQFFNLNQGMEDSLALSNMNGTEDITPIQNMIKQNFPQTTVKAQNIFFSNKQKIERPSFANYHPPQSAKPKDQQNDNKFCQKENQISNISTGISTFKQLTQPNDSRNTSVDICKPKKNIHFPASQVSHYQSQNAQGSTFRNKSPTNYLSTKNESQQAYYSSVPTEGYQDQSYNDGRHQMQNQQNQKPKNKKRSIFT